MMPDLANPEVLAILAELKQQVESQGKKFPDIAALAAMPPPRVDAPKPPNLLRRAASFARAATRHVLHGLPVVSDEERERRLSICRGCEFYTEAGTCRICACPMKRKASWALETCPIQKW